LNFKTNCSISQPILKEQKRQTTFWKSLNKAHLMLPNSWEAMLRLQDFSYSISFLLTPGPTIYQSSSLIWTLNLTFIKEQILFVKRTIARMNICQSETLSTPFRDLYIFAKKNQGPLCYKSWEAHLQNYMYAVPE